MCGRFSLIDGTQKIEKRFGGRFVSAEFETLYNGGPSMHMPIIVRNEAGELDIVQAQWGLRPEWATHLRPQANARLDTASERKMFKDAFQSRHCLIPANSFFEWHREKGITQPYRIMVHNGELFGMAGIWEPPSFPDTLPNFAVLTTDANALVARIHDRMPVILSERDEKRWLSEPALPSGLETTYAAHDMQLYPVSTKVNKVSFNEPAALEPIPEPSLGI